MIVLVMQEKNIFFRVSLQNIYIYNNLLLLQMFIHLEHTFIQSNLQVGR